MARNGGKFSRRSHRLWFKSIKFSDELCSLVDHALAFHVQAQYSDQYGSDDKSHSVRELHTEADLYQPYAIHHKYVLDIL